MAKTGFLLLFNQNLYFLPTNRQRKSKGLINEIITKYMNYQGYDVDQYKDWFTDPELRQVFIDRIEPFNYEVKGEDNYKYHCFTGKYSLLHYPLDSEKVRFLA